MGEDENGLLIGNVNPISSIIKKKQGIILLKGHAVSNGSDKVLIDTIQFVNDYMKANNNLVIYFKLELFDDHFLKVIFQLFSQLNRFHRLGKDVKVKWGWRLATSLMKSSGEDFKKMYDFPFELFESNN